MHDCKHLRLTVATLFVCSQIWTVSSTHAADHLDAPSLAGNGHLDINDLYVFQSPMHPSHTVLIMTVNPFAGDVSGTTFGTADVEYEFLIDNDGDAKPDLTYGSTFFANPDGGNQIMLLTRNDAAIAFGTTDSNTSLPTFGGGMAQAGIFDDPFFFDLAGFQDNFNFTGTDAFAGANVSAIVLEIPSADLGGPNIGVWARTMLQHHQVDRMGRPAINTALIPSAKKDAFNLGEPDRDLQDFGDDVRTSIESLSGDPAHAASLTSILLPDLLTFDTSSGDGFLNGRQLSDDVIDAELDLLTKGAVSGDGVDTNDIPFLGTFPYLAPAHVIPEPSALALLLVSLPILCGRSRRSGNHR